MKPDILVTNPLLPAVMDELERHFTLHPLFEASEEKEFLAARAAIVRGIATFSWPVRAELIAALPKLEIVAAMSVGIDMIDLAAARARGVAVTNAPGVLTDDVADLAIGLLIAAARRLPAAERFLRAGQWRRGEFPLSRKLSGARLGILGLGRIGLAIAKRAEAFGLSIAYHGPNAKPGVAYRYYPRLIEMAADVDYLVLACPGGAATRHLVNAEVLTALGPEGALVNIARGSVVDEAALVAALEAGRLGAAGLDVYADEPNVPDALMALDTVVLTPHVGSATQATRVAMGQLMVDNLRAHFAGRALLTRCA